MIVGSLRAALAAKQSSKRCTINAATTLIRVGQQPYIKKN